jgi:hypothetical protein
MKKMLMLCCLMAAGHLQAQELYVFTEPASNMPARSLGVKQSAKLIRNNPLNRNESRHTTELMLGANRNLMLHGAVTFSDMYTSSTRFESVRAYAKYRFYTSDGMYSHFRLAAFAEAAHSRNPGAFDEISLEGDQSGAQVGLIATQLLHKLALSTSISYTEVLGQGRWDKAFPQTRPYKAFNYSLSGGYLILPRKYTSYGQTNFNVYVELLGQQTTDLKKYALDLAPAAQLIFNSQAKLNLGYRFQLDGNMNRMANRSWLLSFEWLFLNVLK